MPLWFATEMPVDLLDLGAWSLVVLCRFVGQVPKQTQSGSALNNLDLTEIIVGAAGFIQPAVHRPAAQLPGLLDCKGYANLTTACFTTSRYTDTFFSKHLRRNDSLSKCTMYLQIDAQGKTQCATTIHVARSLQVGGTGRLLKYKMGAYGKV